MTAQSTPLPEFDSPPSLEPSNQPHGKRSVYIFIGVCLAVVLAAWAGIALLSHPSESKTLDPDKWTTLDAMGQDLALVTDVCSNRIFDDIGIDSGPVGGCISDYPEVDVVFVNTAKAVREIKLTAADWDGGLFTGTGFAEGKSWGAFCGPSKPGKAAEDRAQETCRIIARSTPDGVYVSADDPDVAASLMNNATRQPAKPAKPAGPKTTFGAGVYLVGTDIKAGTYRTAGGSGCYWERLSGLGGTSADRISNGLIDGPTVVSISPTDKAFKTDKDCGIWTLIE